MENGLWEAAARQLLRALRGGRSQVACARRLGYRSNVFADWEVGRRYPSGVRALAAAERLGVDVDRAMERFHPKAAAAWRDGGLSAWFGALQGTTPRRDLAERSGLSVPQVGRYLRGQAEPRLPELLRLIDAATGRAGDWAAELVDIALVPALAGPVFRRREVVDLVYHQPWTAAVLAVLSTLGSETADPVGAVAARLGQPRVDVEALVERLVRSGVVERREEGFAVRDLTVEIPPDPADLKQVRRHWGQVASDRLGQPGASDRFLFNVCAVSREDLRRVIDLQTATFREIRSLAAASDPAEVVALVVLHTLVW